jgi:hypothetical protein
MFRVRAFKFGRGEILFQVRGWPICDINVAAGSIFSDTFFHRPTFSD